MAVPPEIKRINHLLALARAAEDCCREAWEELDAAPAWKLFTCMRLRRLADEHLRLAAGYYREADRLTEQWEAGQW